MDFNTCFATTNYYHTIAYYSHLVPVAVALFLAVFVLVKSRYNLLSKLFFLFVLGFSIWLIGDVVIWTTQNYYLVTWFWAPLDYINIAFYLLGCYFFFVLLNDGNDIANWQKIVLFILSIPAWWITVNGGSIVDFFHPWCEATNNEFLTNYKLGVEMLSVGLIMISATHTLFKRSNKKRRTQIGIVALALALFLTTFASTENIASQTGIYEIHLYSLFVLPLFLAMIIYSITNLRIFAFRTFGTQLLVGVLLIMVGSQFFFLSNTTDQYLTLITFGLSLFLAIILLRNVRREDLARRQIEKLANELQEANAGQGQLIHFINHQIKGFFNKAQIVFTELLTEPDYGEIPAPAKKMLEQGEGAVKDGVKFVQDILRASDIEKGTYAYDMKPLDLSVIVREVEEEMQSLAESKGLEYKLEITEGKYQIQGDTNQLREAVRNLISNSISYTPKGSVHIKLSSSGSKILLTIQDTGVGLSDEVKPKLFTKGGRDKDSQKINVNSTGYGLSIVKGVVLAHKGRVWAESAGVGKGSTFYMELPLNS